MPAYSQGTERNNMQNCTSCTHESGYLCAQTLFSLEHFPVTWTSSAYSCLFSMPIKSNGNLSDALSPLFRIAAPLPLTIQKLEHPRIEPQKKTKSQLHAHRIHSLKTALPHTAHHSAAAHPAQSTAADVPHDPKPVTAVPPLSTMHSPPWGIWC
eukprot:scaffold312031_cov18-Tisochrysis_lutea.AAC.1